MALKIRLTRLGDKGNAFYRVVVTEARCPRDGKFIGVLGTYDPKGTDDATAIKIDKDLAMEWLAKGALPTDTARVLLEKVGILEKTKKKPAKKTPAPKPKKEKK